MPRTILTISLLFLFSLGSAQNLVPNPSFEDHTYPLPIGYFAPHWFSIRSCDHLHPLNGVSTTPPNTGMGYAVPVDGNAYAGAIMHTDQIEVMPGMFYREVMGVKLLDTLTKDSAYCISFYYVNSGHEMHTYGIDNIGAVISTDSLSALDVINTAPTIRTTQGFINSENEWRKCEGYFISQNNESFLSIGTFGPESSINSIYEEVTSWGYQYYFIDLVEVRECNLDSISDYFIGQLPNVITPNQDEKNDVFRFAYYSLEELTISVYNRWGNLVINYDGLTNNWDGKDNQGNVVSDGVYYIIVNGVDLNGGKHQKKQMVQVISD